MRYPLELWMCTSVFLLVEEDTRPVWIISNRSQVLRGHTICTALTTDERDKYYASRQTVCAPSIQLTSLSSNIWGFLISLSSLSSSSSSSSNDSLAKQIQCWRSRRPARRTRALKSFWRQLKRRESRRKKGPPAVTATTHNARDGLTDCKRKKDAGIDNGILNRLSFKNYHDVRSFSRPGIFSSCVAYRPRCCPSDRKETLP